MSRLAPLVALSLLLCAPTYGQAGRAKLRHYDRPLRSATLDLATGTVTRGPRARERAGTTVADFTNLDLTGFVGLDTGLGACEWIDAAVKGFAGNASDRMTEVVFAYCSSAVDVSAGGPGGSVLLGFYEGYTVGGPAPTTSVALFQLTGLPGASGAGGICDPCPCPFPYVPCFYFTLKLDECVAFADGPIGYSWGFTDWGTCSPLAATGPILACVQSCSGMGPDAQGMVNLIDQYCPPGGVANTFSFGTLYFTSIALEIREVADAEAVASTWNGDGVNTDTLQANAIAIGAAWQLDIALGHAHGASGATSIKVRSACIDGPSLTSPSGHPFEVLTTGSLALVLADPHDGSTTSYAPFAVPCDITLVGLAWAAQGTVLGGGRADLTSARCGVVGSIDMVADP